METAAQLSFLVKLRACCPARSTLLRVSAETEKEARGKALKHCNPSFVRNDWKVVNIREASS